MPHLMVSCAIHLKLASRVVFHSPTELLMKALRVLLMLCGFKHSRIYAYMHYPFAYAYAVWSLSLKLIIAAKMPDRSFRVVQSETPLCSQIPRTSCSQAARVLLHTPHCSLRGTSAAYCKFTDEKSFIICRVSHLPLSLPSLSSVIFSLYYCFSGEEEVYDRLFSTQHAVSLIHKNRTAGYELSLSPLRYSPFFNTSQFSAGILTQNLHFKLIRMRAASFKE